MSQEDIQSLFPPRIGEKPILVEYAQTISEITPGNMFRHYSPTAKVHIISNTSDIPPPYFKEGLGEDNSMRIEKNMALIATTEFLTHHKSTLEKYFPNLTIFKR